MYNSLPTRSLKVYAVMSMVQKKSSLLDLEPNASSSLAITHFNLCHMVGDELYRF